MTAIDPSAVLAAVDAAARAQRASDDAGFDAALRAIPVEVRAVIAVAVLVAADRPVNQKQVAATGRFSRAMFHKKAELLATALEATPPLAAALLEASRPGASVTDLEAELQRRDAVIAVLRESLEQARHDLAVMTAYARDLDEQLRPEYEDNLRTRSHRVVDAARRFTVVDEPEPTAT